MIVFCFYIVNRKIDIQVLMWYNEGYDEGGEMLGLKFKRYVRERHSEFVRARSVRTIGLFSEDEGIQLAEAGAECFGGDRHPEHPWQTREWLEQIYCVLHHGCCNGCKAKEICQTLSQLQR